MLVFMGQASYIRWFDGNLYLDTSDYDAVLSATVPFISPNREKEPNKEFLRLASLKNCLKCRIWIFAFATVQFRNLQ